MTRVRITHLSPLLVVLGAMALVMAGLGTVVALWAPAASASHQAPRELHGCEPANPCLAIVIDDVGRDPDTLKQLLAIPLDLTFSVLPHARHTAAALRALRREGREILLHLPMAPLDAGRITDEAVVLGRDGPLEAALELALGRVPDAVGVNNHMGSALCRDPGKVRAVLQGLRRRGIWFLDSRTADGSVFCQQARSLGVPCKERDVFLDHPPQPGVPSRRLGEAVQTAQQRGWAVAIAHPHQLTVRLLQKVEHSKLKQKVRIRRLSELYKGVP